MGKQEIRRVPGPIAAERAHDTALTEERPSWGDGAGLTGCEGDMFRLGARQVPAWRGRQEVEIHVVNTLGRWVSLAITHLFRPGFSRLLSLARVEAAKTLDGVTVFRTDDENKTTVSLGHVHPEQRTSATFRPILPVWCNTRGMRFCCRCGRR